MAKIVSILLLALLAISMLATTVLAANGKHHHANVCHNVQGGVAKHSTTSHACSSAKSAATSACVFHLVPMETRLFVHVTTTGRPRKEDPNALELHL
ncbi:BURP domain-containing-like protein [Capsicum annuum]|nr:BURP domain-containing-like protein [Capsicum annuum]